MFDSITKALTIQISADDLTGGAWSGLTKSTKDVWNNVTAMNQAWELGSKIYNVAFGTLQAGLDKIASAGEYNEAKAGFASMAESHGQSADYMTRKFLEATEGLVGIESATKAMSQALRYGFSADQTAEIWQFANKFTDTFGGSMETVAGRIEELIYRGDKKSLKALQLEFGLVIGKSEEWAGVSDKLNAKMAQMGTGAYNLGDALQGVGNSWGAVSKSIFAEVNNMIGESGFDAIFKAMRQGMLDILEEAPLISRAIFGTIIDDAKGAADIVGNQTESIFGFMFDSTDSLKTRINTLAIFIGDRIFDVSQLLKNTYNLVVSPWIAAMVLVDEAQLKIIKARDSFWGSDRIGFDSNGKSQEVIDLEAQIQEAKNMAFDTKGLAAAHDEYNQKLVASGESTEQLIKRIREHNKANDEQKSGLDRVGEAFDKVAKSSEKAKIATNKYFAGQKTMVGDVASDLAKLVEVQQGIKRVAGEVYNVDGVSIQTGFNRTGQAQSIPQTAQGATQRGGPLKIEVAGKDGALKELVEYLIETITTKAVAEGLITAGV